MFSQNMRYEVEWVDKSGDVWIEAFYARSASLAYDKAKKELDKRANFDYIELVDLDD